MMGFALVRWRAVGLLVLACLVVFCVRLAAWQSQLIADEGIHVAQVQAYLSGSLDANPYLAMIPGYHAVLAALMSVAGLSSMGGMRGMSALFGAIAAVIFYAIRRKLGDDKAVFTAALFYVFPLFYPYYFLAYTDIFSMMVVLLAVLQAVSGRHLLAACVVTLSIAVRQNNVIWGAFLAAYAAWPALARADVDLRKKCLDGFVSALPYVMPALAFLGYWYWNGSIVFSAAIAEAHPDMTLRAGNVWFTLFLFLVFFPFEAWNGLKSFCRALRARPWLWLIPLACACVKMHGSGDNHVSYDYFIRNAFIAMVSHGWAKVGFGIVVAFAAGAIAYTRFRDPRGVLVYPFSIVCLSSSILIENRYSMIPFALWMAFRKDESPRWMIVVWLLLSVWLTYNVLNMKFML